MSKSMPETAGYGTTEAAFHYPWCDQTRCVHADEWVGQHGAGFVHFTRTITKEISGLTVGVVGYRFRADWTEDESPTLLLVEGLDGALLGDTSLLAEFIRKAGSKLVRLTDPRPPVEPPCPDWCDGTGYGHDWTYVDPCERLDGTIYAGHWRREHFGLSQTGKSCLWRLEWAEADGTVRGSTQVHHRIKSAA